MEADPEEILKNREKILKKSWEEILNDASRRSREFTLQSPDKIDASEGVILADELYSVDCEVSPPHGKVKADQLAHYWFWVYIQIIQKLLFKGDANWISLGFFEKNYGVEQRHWLYFCKDDLLNDLLKAFSMVGNKHLNDTYIKGRLKLAYEFYEDKYGNEEIKKPLCILFDAEIDGKTLETFEEFTFVERWHTEQSEARKKPLTFTVKAGVDLKKNDYAYTFHSEDEYERLDEVERQFFVREDHKVKYLRFIQEALGSHKESMLLILPAILRYDRVPVFREIPMIISFPKQIPEDLLSKLILAHELTSLNISLYSLRTAADAIRSHAIKSAISAIMSRNGSHNIGSHVINRVVEEMDSLNIQDHKYFLRYLQQRLDFVALISTEFTKWSTSGWFLKEVMRTFYSQHHLLNNIARSEGLVSVKKKSAAASAAGQVAEQPGLPKSETIKCIIETVKKYECEHYSPDPSQNSCPNKKAGNGINHYACLLECKHTAKHDQILVCSDSHCIPGLDGDIQVAIPGGLIGFHAFYTIMENFLRNSAKHCFAPNPRKERDMIITLKIWNYENCNRKYILRLRDNYSYVSGLVDKDDAELKEADLESKLAKGSLIICSDDTAAMEKAPAIIQECIKSYISAKTYSAELGNIVFIVDDGEVFRTNGYLDLMRKDNIRFVEKAYWDEFLDTRDIDKDKFLTFLKKYYVPDHIRINKRIMQSLIEDDGNLRKNNWGIAEMKISAGFLNGMDIDEIGGKGKDNLDNLLKAIAVPELDESTEGVRAFRLGYEFKLRKPVDVLLIGYTCQDEELKRRLERESVITTTGSGEYHSAEMAVLYDSTDNECILFKQLLNGGKIEDIKQEIEKYPGRFFLAASAHTFQESSKRIGDSPFLRKRIALIRKEEVDNWLKSGDIKIGLKNKLVKAWVGHIKEKIKQLDKETVGLLIEPEERRSGEIESSDSLLTSLAYLYVMKNTGIRAEVEIRELRSKLITGAMDHISVPYEFDKAAEATADEIISFFKPVLEQFGIDMSSEHKPSTLPAIFDVGKVDLAGKRDAYKKAMDNFSSAEIRMIEHENGFPQRMIVYQRHRKHMILRDRKKFLYQENLGGGAMHFHTFSNPPGWIESAVMNLLENGMLNIGIMDERVAGSGVLKAGDYYTHLVAGGIEFVNRYLGFKLDYAYGQESDFVAIDNLTVLDSNIDIFIIHQGILDKIYKGREKEDIEKDIAVLKDKIPLIFVTSGRGRPAEIPRGVKFIPFGIIETTLLQRPHSKLLLMKQLLGGISE